MRQVLGELTRANLLAEQIPGRFGCHDLLRAFAEEQTGAFDSEIVRRDALHRVVSHYLHTAHAAALLMSPGREPLNLPLQTGVDPEHLADGDAARAWFEAERKVLLSVIAQAARNGLEVHAWQRGEIPRLSHR
jgi:hypothetical protein